MIAVRLLADDLTGALDTAAELVPLAGPIEVRWSDGTPLPARGSRALDSGTREKPLEEARAELERLAAQLDGGDLAYKKVDSLLRGHPMAELAACLRGGRWDGCIVAPAFPFQGRVTRGGRQFASRPDGTWRDVADLVDLLGRAGIAADRAPPGAVPSGRVTVFDAETDRDLDRVVLSGRARGGRILWCGSAGLAQAIARDAPAPAARRFAGPALGLFGSDQEVTARQLAACRPLWHRLAGTEDDAPAIGDRLRRDGVALASLALPAGTARAEAARLIARAFAGLVARLDRPGTLLVAGGETLRDLCEALGATGLVVGGQIEPGLPHSAMRGGRWDGLAVVSKSGAFGRDALWADLLVSQGLGPLAMQDAAS